MEVDLGLGVSSVFGVIALVVYVWAIINVFQSQATKVNKVIWILLILVLPLLGLILWSLLGPKRTLEWP